MLYNKYMKQTAIRIDSKDMQDAKKKAKKELGINSFNAIVAYLIKLFLRSK